MIEQIAIFVFGVTAVWLTQDVRRSRQRWACIIGLCGQPFWLYASFTAAQWGIFAAAILYTACWIRGIHTHWIKP